MAVDPSALDRMVTALVPSLSRSLAEQFNVFRVMRHGTHEKQLSNVFAWLLTVDGTHDLGDAFQRLFVEAVNEDLPPRAVKLPACQYQVVQEVDTSGHEERGKDIADIVLTCATACIVVENYEFSDGHGHGYNRYLAYGAAGGRHSVVVLLCSRWEAHRQADGWENAVVVTYAELLRRLEAHVAADTTWRRSHPHEYFFIQQMLQHFVEGAPIMSTEDRIAFIKTMCETGESARYGQRPQDVAAQEFADLLAHHAKRQFEEGRGTLADVKRALKQFATQNLRDQVNAGLQAGLVTTVETRFVGQWEWCVTLRRSNSQPAVFLEFGPTAVVENKRARVPIERPDYTTIFLTRQATGHDGIDVIAPTSVGLGEVLAGLGPEDTRLRDGILAIISAPEALQS